MYPGRPLLREVRRDHAYGWAAALIGAVGAIGIVLNGIGWFSLPMDITGAGAWFFVVSVMLIAPFTLLLLLCAWGLLALLRKAGGRRWPGVVQGLFASGTTLAVVAIIAWILFTYDPNN